MRYDRQVVIALIDGPKIRYNGVEISTLFGGNYNNFLNDAGVSAEDKAEFTRQQGERDTAENLHEKNEDASTLHIVEDCVPNSPAQRLALGNVVTSIPRQKGATMRIYLIAHNDPDVMRFAGLPPDDLAAIVAQGLTEPIRPGFIGPVPPRNVTRITLVGCHTAGEAASADDADRLIDSDSFARRFHRSLGNRGILTQVAGYTSYVQISAFGNKRTGFGEGGGRARKTLKSKILFDWGLPFPNDDRPQICRHVYN